MTSLLAFAWRKANMPTCSTTNTSSSSTHSSLNDKKSSSQQPDLTTTDSSGSLTAPGSSDSLFESPKISCLDGPNTPEALRGRQTAREIREDLGLPPKRLDWRFQDREDEEAKEACYEKNFEDRTIGKSPPRSPMGSLVGAGFATLPPMFGGFNAPSPQISTSSLYSRTSRSCQQVASSPNLSVGQARTAVGALVAMAETRVLRPPSASKGKRKNCSQKEHLVPLHNEHSILPPRKWLDDERTLEEAQDFSIDLPYEPLDESKGHLSPVSRRTLSDDESSIHASPSSNQQRLEMPSNLPETSFTRGFLQAESSYFSNVERPYDFNSIVDKEFIVSEPQSSGMNMSAISQGTAQDLESLHSLPSPEDLAIVAYDNPRKQTKEHIICHQDQNERRVKEDMLLSLLERLQDDNKLVLEIMEACKDARPGTVKLEQDNFFSGFHQSQREKILQDLDMKIREHQTQTNWQSGEESIHSLSLCRSFLSVSVPLEEKMEKALCAITGAPQHGHRWKRVAGFRALLGFDEEPRSPETVRGGDTSLFSLPSDSAHDTTPHTSNVSMTSTITSAVTPDKQSEKRLGYANRPEALRLTIETACILFEKLGTEVNKLSERKAGSMSMVIQEIQSLCWRLLNIPTEDLRGLIDSFELDLLPMGISRMVSEDQGDNYQNGFLNNESVSPEPTVSAAQLLISQTMGISLDALDTNIVDKTNLEREKGDDLFSPNSEDMRSIEQTASASPDDDLRRTVGSFDLNDVTEERDASPPYIPLVDEQIQAKKVKPRRGIFRRRVFRRRQAAE